MIPIISVLFFQNCLTLTKGAYQRIPVTSNLTDARVFVDGKEIGVTLVKTGAQAREFDIVLPPERLNNTHWIRISYSDNDKFQ